MKKDRLLKYLAIGIWIAVLLAIVIGVCIVVRRNVEESEQAEYIDSLVDLASETETLHPGLAEAIKDDPNYDYQTGTAQSKYTEVLGKYLYDSKDEEKKDSLENALASGAGIIIQRKVEPEDFVFETTEEFNAAESRVLEKYNLELVEKAGMNANILNYHLDKGGVVVIFAKGEEPYSEDGKAVLVFGGYLVDGLYFIFSPEKTREEGEERTEMIPKTKLFESIQSDEKFYILRLKEQQNA